jgi:hypothetical protein
MTRTSSSPVATNAHVLLEAVWQVHALGFVGEIRRTANRHDHPPGRPRSFNEQLPRLLSGDVAGRHAVAVEVDVCRAVAALHEQEGMLRLLTHDERITDACVHRRRVPRHRLGTAGRRHRRTQANGLSVVGNGHLLRFI